MGSFSAPRRTEFSDPGMTMRLAIESRLHGHQPVHSGRKQSLRPNPHVTYGQGHLAPFGLSPHSG